MSGAETTLSPAPSHPSRRRGGKEGTIKVWDPLVRLFHWSLVTGIALAWITSEGWDRAHEITGYIIAGLVGFRLLWGLIGSKHARFSDFVRGPGAVLAYVKQMPRGRAPRFIGHNPAGGAMVVLLILSTIAICLTGWMMSLDAFWGVEWVEDVHEAFATAMLVLIGLHVAGVIYSSLEHRENLVRAMVTGRKKSM
jgi:cytochrome b